MTSGLLSKGFGGGELRGERIVQLVYLDEAGISNRTHEPYLVVAGVIVNADKKWKELEQHLYALAEECRNTCLTTAAN